ncbi:MAG TPA: VWA domain-containing protein [Bryobacteraceae bacterium]|nr:VWA domain-containing protein [Bryobacteraceae bacterium]
MPHRMPALTGVAFIFALSAWSAEQAPVSIPARTVHSGILSDIRVDSNLVLIPVSVTDSKNHAVTGLQRESFRVFEGKAEQTLVHFASEDAPVSVGIVFDSSGSMKDKLAQSREAVARFLKTANPEDEFFLVDFNSTAQLAAPFTRDAGGIQNRILFSASDGRTALLDAVCLAIDYMKKARNPRKALLIVSDGGDNHSRYTESEILRRVRESDLWIYAIGIGDSGAIMLPEVEYGGTLLARLAEESGGRHYAARHAAELPEIAEDIGLELRNEYVLGYRPANSGRDGKYHRVQVRVEGRDLRVTWRPGYFEPE